MNAGTLTLNEVRIRGLDALERELGRVGMIRFLQQFEQGTGDYSRQRHASVDKLGLSAAVRQIKVARQRRRST